MADDEEDAAPEDAALPWDDQTDAFITDIDQTVLDKYKVSVRTLLIDPATYAETSGIEDTVKSVKEEVDSYFEKVMADLTIDQQELTKDMEAADSLYTKIDQAISSKAAVARVPYIKPVNIDIGNPGSETIYVDQYNNSIDSLITKFVNISNYIGNLSSTYKKYNLGSWLFSGQRNYTLAVNQPESIVITVENSQDYIIDGIDNALTLLSAAPSK